MMKINCFQFFWKTEKQESLAKKTETLKEELDRWDGYLGQVCGYLCYIPAVHFVIILVILEAALKLWFVEIAVG
jgi:hypothetical protein